MSSSLKLQCVEPQGFCKRTKSGAIAGCWWPFGLRVHVASFKKNDRPQSVIRTQRGDGETGVCWAERDLPAPGVDLRCCECAFSEIPWHTSAKKETTRNAANGVICINHEQTIVYIQQLKIALSISRVQETWVSGHKLARTRDLHFLPSPPGAHRAPLSVLYYFVCTSNGAHRADVWASREQFDCELIATAIYMLLSKAEFDCFQEMRFKHFKHCLLYFWLFGKRWFLGMGKKIRFIFRLATMIFINSNFKINFCIFPKI